MRFYWHEIGRGMGLACAVFGLAALTSLAPVAGCARQEVVDAKKELEKLQKKEKPKPPFETFKVFTEPNEKSFTDPAQKDPGRIVQAIKPGHWASVLVETKANNFDFGGELVSTPLDIAQNPILLDRSPFCLITSRSIALPKGQRKSLEALFYAARSAHTSTQISNRLYTRQHNEQSQAFPDTLSHMPSFQYFMVVLSRDPSRYRFLKLLESVSPIGGLRPINPEEAAYYRLVLPQTNQPLALSTHSLCWTSMAYIVWDDVLPTALTPEQQQALLDWLHWGGGLIISGPLSLDLLRGTFLEPYLPATAAETTTIDAAALAELNAHWSLSDAQGQRILQPAAPWSGVKLAKHPQAEFVRNTGELVVERRVGRGRVVATAFRLSERELWNWRCFDSFFNSCILRRPRRSFPLHRDGFEFVDGGNQLDPGLVTNVRFFTRDANDPKEPSKDAKFEAISASVVQAKVRAAAGANQVTLANANFDLDRESDEVDAYKKASGVAAWNDFSWISSSARQTLRDAAGISVPQREFVVWMLGIYLVVIVPVNWLVFRLLGRVEWAWIAVPIVAIGWGVAVIWLAQLDIGFARAETQVAVIEAQNDFPRAHLTRYTAFYTSLSTSYDVHFDDPLALAQPFSVDIELLRDQGHATVALASVGDRQLRGFPVSSNSTGMVHSEQMFDMGGSLVWRSESEDAPTLENNTSLDLSDVAIIRRQDDENEVVELAWLGDVEAGAKLDVAFRPYDQAELDRLREQSIMTGTFSEGRLSLRRLVECAQDLSSLQAGDVRLVAWREGELAGVRIEPAAAQARRATLVVANLQFAQGQPPLPDLNLRAERSTDLGAPREVEPEAVP